MLAPFLTYAEPASLASPPALVSYPESAAELIAAMGFANSPTSFWRFTAAAGAGSESDLVGSNDLTVNGGTQGVADGPLGSATYETADNATDAMQAASTSVFDQTTGNSFALLVVCRSYRATYADRNCIGKKSGITTAEPGYMLSLRTGANVYFELADGSVFDRCQNTEGWAAGTPLVALAGYDDSSGDVYLHTLCIDGLGDTVKSDTDSRGAGSITNSEKFGIGAASALNAAETNFALAAYWDGADSEGLGASHVTALAGALGIE